MRAFSMLKCFPRKVTVSPSQSRRVILQPLVGPSRALAYRYPETGKFLNPVADADAKLEVAA
jgi:hypothetical protein